MNSLYKSFTLPLIKSRAATPLRSLWKRVIPESLTVTRRIAGLKMRMSVRSHSACVFSSGRGLFEYEPFVEPLLRCAMRYPERHIWDLGANFGMYSLWLASKGYHVIAVELSPRNCKLIFESMELNNLNDDWLCVIQRAVSAYPGYYVPPMDGRTTNAIDDFNPGSPCKTITWNNLVDRGVPSVIKMDIEREEENFLKHDVFQRWVREMGVPVLMEVHRTQGLELFEKHNWDRLPHYWYKKPAKSYGEFFDVGYLFINP